MAAAQGINIRLETRYSFAAEDDSSYGIKGDYLNVRINGSINENLRYSMHQRLNKPIYANNNPFNATDWVYLLYRKGNWGVQAGKMQLEYGGYEFDEAPINLYWSSEFYNNFEGAFAFALSGLYYLGESSRLVFQIAQSPFGLIADKALSYSLCARGHSGFYGWKHSVNLFEIPEGGHVGNIALGNSFTAGPARLELDLVQRGNMESFRMFDDCAVIANLVVSPASWMNIMAKFTYDCNFSQYDPLIPEFGEYWSYGGGFEFFPKKDDKDIRIHAMYYKFHQSSLLVGLTWKIRLLKR